MREALKEARLAQAKEEVPIGCVVVHGGVVVGRGHNQTESLQDPTAHAEMIAVTAAAATLGSRRLLDCALYVTLEPCAMCAGAIVLSRVPLVVYGAADPKAGAVRSIVDRETGQIHVFELIFPEGQEPDLEDEEAVVDYSIAERVEVTPDDFGRIAAPTGFIGQRAARMKMTASRGIGWR
jgi:tRNA(adenine34) deaminase